MALSRVVNLRTFAFIIVAFVLATVAYGFAAANTVEDSAAGDGEAVISGYDITAVTYNLDDTNPFNVGSVSFTVTNLDADAGDATEVEINLDGGSDWFSCSESVAGSGNFTCDVGTVAVVDATSLRVVAVQ